MTYLYGLLSPDADPGPAQFDGIEGVTGEVRLSRLPQGVLIHADHDGSDIRPKRRNLLAHARILERALGMGTVLPMRFGMVAHDLPAVAAALAGQQDRLAAEMIRLQNAVEFGIRVEFERAPALQCLVDASAALQAERDRLRGDPRTTERDRAAFGSRLAAALDRARTDAQRRVLAALRPRLRDHVIRVPDSDVQVLALDALVETGAETDLPAAIDAAARTCGFATGLEPIVRMVGPVPPYTFTRLVLPCTEAA
ncbi:GvpL/GvpF family gas vesicle protein [Roseivivax isoporae]|uniref:Gas vesicle protein n=1 Tax=Roseivivax isoporae LMG 25204 TaxID=1449351 RepID=X7F973_9RHOB|nr:GvpL/GvpF family gas vesicle protein [Roseivivax isoporae]ETX29355.1 hypothetical protein RISW2_01410 [Roseivivax isoporae LMG 25204]